MNSVFHTKASSLLRPFRTPKDPANADPLLTPTGSVALPAEAQPIYRDQVAINVMLTAAKTPTAGTGLKLPSELRWLLSCAFTL